MYSAGHDAPALGNDAVISAGSIVIGNVIVGDGSVVWGWSCRYEGCCSQAGCRRRTGSSSALLNTIDS